jgi:hypothetical protein
MGNTPIALCGQSAFLATKKKWWTASDILPMAKLSKKDKGTV